MESPSQRSTAETARAYWELMRLDRPVGSLLLLWPTLAALWIAEEGTPPIPILVIFVLGTFVMRAAGCVINDLADQDFDPHVERTRSRPLADGRLKTKDALVCLAFLLLIGFCLVLSLNVTTWWMALGGVLISAIYPFMKRFTHLPQLILGVAFSWGILMAGTAISNAISLPIFCFFAMSFVWIVAYDTQYAMVDREDDLKIGLKSTAILLGWLDRYVIAALQLTVLALLLVLGAIAKLNVLFLFSTVVVACLFFYQSCLTWSRKREHCFRAFKNNATVGLVLFTGIVLNYMVAVPGHQL
ncbi:MAG: 4-hydroxybenzoate octaprenyltransferase [Gammaproteobacteria bacterium]|nr:4-hydroxybenzoate octaprenyltransferase [Gammaproteobacteria bacterium]